MKYIIHKGYLMFTAIDIIECLVWVIGYILIPCVMIYGLWFALHRIPNQKARLVSDFIRCVLFVFIVLFVLFYMAIPTLVSWPPHWLERARQRQMVYQRVQDAGGWEAIRRDANELVQKYASTGYTWFALLKLKDEPAPPASFASLKPKQVDLYDEADGMCSVRINIFGYHSTGGRGQDSYTVKIVCPYPTNMPRHFHVNEDAKVRYGNRKIAEGIFEVTHPS